MELEKMCFHQQSTCVKTHEVYEDVYMYMNINPMKISFSVIYKFSRLETTYKMNSLKQKSDIMCIHTGQH